MFVSSGSLRRVPIETHPVSAQDSLRFSNLLARLLDQVVLFLLAIFVLIVFQDLLTRKHAVLQFMAALSSSSNQPPPIIPPLMPSISRSSPASPLSRSRRSSMIPPAVSNQPPSSAKSKAQLLKEYRARHGRPQISEALLLRDALYLLQGISGKVVRFNENKADGELTVVFSEDPVSACKHL